MIVCDHKLGARACTKLGMVADTVASTSLLSTQPLVWFVKRGAANEQHTRGIAGEGVGV